MHSQFNFSIKILLEDSYCNMEAPNEDRKSDKCKWPLTERVAGCCDALILKVVLSRAAAKSGEQMGSPSNVLADERAGRTTTEGSLRCASLSSRGAVCRHAGIRLQSACRKISFLVDKVNSARRGNVSLWIVMLPK